MKWAFIFFAISIELFAAHIVTESSHQACQELRLVKELKVYKDPSLFLSNLNQIYADPENGMEDLMRENPLLTTVKGSIHIMRLGSEREFKNFGAIARLYELSDPKFKGQQSDKTRKVEKNPLIVPIKICGGDAYSESMGFVLVSDLKSAQTVDDVEGGALPPSTVGNPIPKLRKD